MAKAVPTRSRDDAVATKIWIAAALIVVAAMLRSPLLEDLTSGVWALQVGRFAPEWLQYTVLLFSVLLAVPAIAALLPGGKGGSADMRTNNTPHGTASGGMILAAGAGVTAAVLFWLFPVPFPFLGDGKHVVSTLIRLNTDAGTSFGTLWLEPVTAWLYQVAGGAAAAGKTGAEVFPAYVAVFRIVAAITGGAFVAYLLRTALRSTEGLAGRVALAGGVLGSAGTLFFFGYIEYYAFLFPLATVMLLLLHEQEDARLSPALFVLLLITTAFHTTAVVFLPAILYAAVPALRRMSFPAVVLALVLLSVLSYVGVKLTGIGDIFIAPYAEGHGFWLFSGMHFSDVLSNIVLQHPVALLVSIAAVAGGARYVSLQSRVMLLAALGWVLVLLYHNAFARDWDIYALMGPALALMAWQLSGELRAAGLRHYLRWQLGLQSLLFLLPWVAVQTSFPSAQAYFSHITYANMDELPPYWNAGHLETLRESYSFSEDPANELRVTCDLLAQTGDPYDLHKLALAMRNVPRYSVEDYRRVRAAMDVLFAQSDSMLRSNTFGEDADAPTLYDAFSTIVQAMFAGLPPAEAGEWEAYIAKKAAGRALDVLLLREQGDAAFAQRDYARAQAMYTAALHAEQGLTGVDREWIPDMQSRSAMARFALGDDAGALSLARAAVAHPLASAAQWERYGMLAMMLRLYDESVPAFREALRRDPGSGNSLYGLGKILLFNVRSRDEGAALLQRALATPVGEANRAEIDALLSQITTAEKERYLRRNGFVLE